MLSRRRSSEQTAPHPSIAMQSSQSLSRLEAALRGVNVLFSVIALPDAPPSARPNVPRPPDSSDPHYAAHPPEHHGKRRLFNRDPRPDRPRRSSTPSPPVHRLVVASSSKNPSQIRLYQLLDYPTIPRVSVTRSWSLSDLRKIDGLGLPVAESLRFGLIFTSSKAFVWRTHTPVARAVFLWSLLQTCVSQLKRAPPVQNLKLLDLQTVAENPETVAADADNDDDASSANYAGSDSNARLGSSFDVLPDPNANAAHSHSRANHSESVPLTANARSDKPSASHFSRPVPPPGASTRLSSHVPLSTAASSRPSRAVPPPPSPRASKKASRARDEAQKLSRTVSEPKVSATAVSSTDSDNDDGLRKPETIAQTPIPPNELGHESARSFQVQNMNIDDLAFLAAAKRMGADKPHHLKRLEVLEHLSVGSDAKARAFQNRLKAADGNTAKVVAERRIQQEKKLYRLSDEERKDLAFALELFGEDPKVVAEKHEGESNGFLTPLADFGAWADAQIQALEVENITDIITAEQASAPLDEPCTEVLKKSKKSIMDEARNTNPYELLVESVQNADDWLQKCETLLGPYASLAADLNEEVILLQLQRNNIVGMEVELEKLLEVIAFDQAEQELINDLDGMQLSHDPAEANYTEIYLALEVVSRKAAALAQLSQLAEMESVKRIRTILSDKQERASKALLPCLKGFLTSYYNNKEQSAFKMKPEDMRPQDAKVHGGDTISSQFLKGARCLAMCGRHLFDQLLDHYISVSSQRVSNAVRSLMPKKGDPPVIEKTALDLLVVRFLEGVFFACLVEGYRAFRFFDDILQKFPSKIHPSMASILRMHVPGISFVEEFTSSNSSENKTAEACMNLHFSHCLDYFATKLTNCGDAELNGIVSRMDRVLNSETSISELRNLSAWTEPDSLASPWATGQFASSDVPEGAPWLSSSTVSFSQPGANDFVVTRDDRVTRDCLSNFLVTHNELALSCHANAERHVNAVIQVISTPRDIGDEGGRAAFFKRVVEAVNLCRELASSTYQGPDARRACSAKAKSLCEKLIAAAMRNTEVSAAVSDKLKADMVKLQCYGYIAARLSDAGEDFLVQLAHLSSRVRKHVLQSWAEENLFVSVFEGVHLDELKRSPTSASALVREGLQSLKAVDAASSVKTLVGDCMESAAKTCAIGPFYSDLISMTKERFEEGLRSARKEKSLADVRPKLLSFSRELLSLLRAEMKKQQQAAVQAEQGGDQ